MAPPPPPSHTFLPLGLPDACHVVGTTVGHCVIHLGEAPKNLHLTVPKSGSNIAQQYVDGYAFFRVHCSTKSQENPKGPFWIEKITSQPP